MQTSTINKQKRETFYQIQYTTRHEPSVWYVSNEFNDNKFKSYVEACHSVRKFIKHADIADSIVTEYRVVELDVTTTTEVLKNFPIK